MNPNDALRKAEEPRIPEPPRPGKFCSALVYILGTLELACTPLQLEMNDQGGA